MEPERIVIPVGSESVSGLLLRPDGAKALYLFAHGAGTNMAHKSMASSAEGLAARGIATLRYNFLYTEMGSKRPDAPKLAHAAVRAAAARAAEIAGDLPIYAGGRSFGGRMTSQAQAAEPLPGVGGLAFLGFPLHPAGKPGVERAAHLADVPLQMSHTHWEHRWTSTLAKTRTVLGHEPNEFSSARATLSLPIASLAPDATAREARAEQSGARRASY